MTDPVKAKIIELLPELWNEGSILYRKREGIKSYITTIELADVLRATRESWKNWDGKTKYDSVEKLREAMYQDFMELIEVWNLSTDYDGQDQPTKDFIVTLIGV